MMPRGSAPGFTILELMVVMGVLSVLFGLGFGFLQTAANDLELAEAVLRDQLRIAALTSRSRHLPTEVSVQPGDDRSPTRLRAQVLAPVGHWHLEPGERWPNDALTPILEGRYVPGRYGYAMQADPDAVALMILQTKDKPYFDLRMGFSLRLDLKLEARQAMSLLRLGDAIELGLDAELRPFARIVVRSGSGGPGGTISVAGKKSLSLNRWQNLQLIQDGRELQLLVDGRLVDSAPVAARLMQTGDESLLVSPGDQPVFGVIDEIQLLAYEYAPSQDLPIGVALHGFAGSIRFDRYGEPVDRLLLSLVHADNQRRDLQLGPGGVIE